MTPKKIMAAKTKFCAFVISGYNQRKNHNRVAFFQKLSKYKRVDSGGRTIQQHGRPRSRRARLAKSSFYANTNSTSRYENRALAGYTTEKIFEPMIARCLPIYWGNPCITKEFNPKSFLNRADFPSDEALIENIIELDHDDAKYLEYLRQPYFYDDKPNLYFNRERILDFFEMIFSQRITPVAQAKRTFFRRIFGRWLLVKRHHWHKMQPPTW